MAPKIPALSLRSGGISALIAVLASIGTALAESQTSPCVEDAMIVCDASGSMSGNLDQGIATLRPKIDEVRSALAEILPAVTRFRRVGLITYGPGPGNQCNVKLDLKPTANAAPIIMQYLEGISPAGKTPLTTAVATAADVLDYRKSPGVIVLLTDGEETCGASPCALGRGASGSCCGLDSSRHQFSHAGIFVDWRAQHAGHQMSRQGEPRLVFQC